MKRMLFVCLLVSGCAIGPDCSDSDYRISKWGICVFLPEADQASYTQETTTQALNLFFDGLIVYASIDMRTSAHDFYRSYDTSITFTQDPIPVAWGESYGILDYSFSSTADKFSIYLTTRGKGPQTTSLTHEMLHTVQFYRGVFHEDKAHAYPENWFVNYNSETGQYYEGQNVEETLEYKLRQYVFCNMEEGPASLQCIPFRF